MRTAISRLIVLGLVLALVISACGPTPNLHYTMADEHELPDFLHGMPERTRDAYRFAIDNPEEITVYPCYCGCVNIGHTSLTSCFLKDGTWERGKTIEFDRHGAGCGVCVDITMDVMRMMRAGKSRPDIRTYVDDKYGSLAPGTNTPFPLG